ncbi:acrosin-like [Catharus ustulatus]|uniref:acrosin-like n=1 Tax=Catharus ustulatus TaxID=91951 RepID=UPI0014079478|nr:acrosin-like [Catharus ustulatus]
MILLCILILLALCGPAHGACGDTCGLRPMPATVSSSRVVGGTDVLPGYGAWAGIVSFRPIWTLQYSMHVCGGTLISPKWVLIAAHCFDNVTNPMKEWAVVIGATIMNQITQDVVVRGVKRVINHEKYDRETVFNDIAVMELDRPVECTSFIQLACLPGPSVKLSELKNCYIAGWGDTYAKSKVGSEILQQAKVQVVNNKLCNSTDYLQGYIHDFHVCSSGVTGLGICQGDSGGPITCQDKSGDFFWQIGVHSWAIGCARYKKPGVSTSTQYYYNWIRYKTGIKPATGIKPTPAVTATPAPAYTSSPLQTLPPSSTKPCPLPREKLLQFFNLLKDILQYLKGKIF